MKATEPTGADASFDEVRRRVRDWLELVRFTGDGEFGRLKYNRGMLRPWGLEPTASAVTVMRTLGLLDELTDERRAATVRTIRGLREPATHLFKDPLIREEDHLAVNPERPGGQPHSWEHIWNHHTNVCITALRELGAAPPFGVPQRSLANLAEVDPREWTLSLVWSRNPWTAGEHWASVVNNYRVHAGLTGPEDSDGRLEVAYETVEQMILDPATGMPSLRGCTEEHRLYAGLFKIMFAYVPCGRAVPNAERAIDFVLDRQNEDGQFSLGGMCLNWDALWVLKHLNDQLGGGYRFEDILGAGGRLNSFLLARHWQSDGGFSFHPGHCLTVHNSIRVSEPLGEGDMIGTHMSVNCLSYVDQWQRAARRPDER